MKSIISSIIFLSLGCFIGFTARPYITTSHSTSTEMIPQKSAIQPTFTDQDEQGVEVLPLVDVEEEEEQFRQRLIEGAYEEALSMYQEQVNSDHQQKYDAIFFTYVKQHKMVDITQTETLLEAFLDQQYSHLQALYYLSEIKFDQSLYQRAIELLYDTYDTYLNDKQKQIIDARLNEYITHYLNQLKRGQQAQDLMAFLQFVHEKESDNPFYMYELAQLNFQLKQYNISKEWFEEILYHEVYAQKAQSYLEKIEQKLAIKEKFQQQIKLERQGSHFIIDATINQTIAVRLLIDTGASITLIDQEILENEMDLFSLETVELNTANGKTQAYRTQVDSFDINGLTMQNFSITIGHLQSDFDGLLGMNYLKNFRFYIDQEEAILYLNPL